VTAVLRPPAGVVFTLVETGTALGVTAVPGLATPTASPAPPRARSPFALELATAVRRVIAAHNALPSDARVSTGSPVVWDAVRVTVDLVSRQASARALAWAAREAARDALAARAAGDITAEQAAWDRHAWALGLAEQGVPV